MMKTLALYLMGRLNVGASTTFCFTSLCLSLIGLTAIATTAQAQASPSNTSTWQPLESRSFAISENISFDRVSADINASLSGEPTGADTVETKSVGIEMESLPIIGEFLDEEGNFNLDLPFTVDFGNLMGESVIIVGTDFTLD